TRAAELLGGSSIKDNLVQSQGPARHAPLRQNSVVGPIGDERFDSCLDRHGESVTGRRLRGSDAVGRHVYGTAEQFELAFRTGDDVPSDLAVHNSHARLP